MSGKTSRMAKNGAMTIELSPDPPEKKAKRVAEDDRGTPLRSIVCLNNKSDLKRFEETEDCFILEFDPFEPINIRELSFDDANDVTIIFEKGQVACRDYPHSRHLCLKHPFETTPHESHCRLCYCYVCDSAAPCSDWRSPGTRHCDASDSQSWEMLRAARKTRQS